MNIKIYKTNERECFVKGEILTDSQTIDAVIRLGKPKQTILGYGGAFTSSSASLYSRLPEKAKEEFLRLYFSSDGLGYNLGRVTIGSCDFSTEMYDYAAKDDLSDFSIAHDKQEIIPMIKSALKYQPLSLVASCWSPLGQWKTNHQKAFGGKLAKNHYTSHVNYMARFIEAYRAEGVNIESITVQNEPAATQIWESCLFSAEEEGEMAVLLHQRLPETKIYIWDHNRDVMNERVNASLLVKGVSEAIYGVAYHWYDGNKNAEIARLREDHPDLHILFTEGCIELLNLNRDNPSLAIGTFQNGVRYAKNYLLDLNYGSEGFIDWNLLLDMGGGPNHVGNYCEAPILTDGISLFPTYSYYFIKHISSFLKKGGRVLEVDNQSNLIAAAANNRDGSVGIVVLNLGQDKTIIRAYINNSDFVDFKVERNEVVSLEIRI